MDSFKLFIRPQYVRQTEVTELFPDGKVHPLHLVQKRMKMDFDAFPEFVIITAPTGTGKSYAFPFPVLNAKKNAGGFNSSIRGLIVLPTNALIDELTENFQKTYPDLTINKITGRVLNDLQKRGFSRWEAILELAYQSDLAIINPDIINYAMHGGYHKNAGEYWKGKTGRKEIPDFIKKFDYIIFDEYHLYDESQIANIWTLVQLRNIFLQENHQLKYFFVSATPENGLKEFLESQDSEVEEIIEAITADSTEARAIHGALEVEFVMTLDLPSLIDSKIDELQQQISQNKKSLLILNNLRAVQILKEELTQIFPKQKIYSSTGYGHDAHQMENIANANIIVATNKAEVGVNYGVEYCIMQPGRYYQNFVQRFGRISRGDLDGKIVVALDNLTFNKLKKLVRENEELDYYDFMDRMRSVLQSKKFYTQLIPQYYGEYLWCIQETIRRFQNYHTRVLMGNRLFTNDFFKSGVAAGRYYLLKEINDLIKEMNEKYPHGHLTRQWTAWWEAYLNSYLSFRDASMVVEFVDKKLNMSGDYSLDWILQHKEVLNIETIDKGNYQIKKYTLGDLKERDKDIEYTVSTIPSVHAKENEFLAYTDVISDKNLQFFFQKAIQRIDDKVRKGITPIDEIQRNLVAKLVLLNKTFNKKRLTIENIDSKDSFL